MGRTLFDINHSKIFFDPPPRVMEIKAKINKWDLMKLKSFYTAKETINRMGENIYKLINGQRINFQNILALIFLPPVHLSHGHQEHISKMKMWLYNYSSYSSGTSG